MASLLSKSDIASLTGMTADDIPADIVTWAESRVEKLLDKDYGTAKTETEEFYLYTDQSYLKLKHENIISISTFTIEDVDEDGLSEDDDEYKLFKEEGIIYCTMLQTFKTITITYTYGNCSVGDLDKYLHLLLCLKKLIVVKPDAIKKESISEKIGDYLVKYNVTELKERPGLIDDEIKEVMSAIDKTDIYFL